MSAQTTSPIDAVRSDIPPKPVTPAEAIPEAPAAALDPLTKPEGGFLEKAKEALLPIVEKAQVTLDQYAEAAEKKVQQLADRLDGTAAPGTAQSRDLTGNAQPASITTTTSDPLEKAKGVFDQVSSAVTSTFTQLTNTIETKTTTESHPGLITQVQNAVAKGQEKLDHLLDGQSTTAASHPVQTTTNTVPHAPIGSDPLAPGAPGTTGALPNPSGAPVPVPGSTLTTTPALPQ